MPHEHEQPECISRIAGVARRDCHQSNSQRAQLLLLTVPSTPATRRKEHAERCLTADNNLLQLRSELDRLAQDKVSLLEELEATDVVLDVGAEVGAFALTAGRRGVASVTAIEADNAMAESLEESANINGLSESFLVLTWLASSSSGYATVFAKAARGCTYSAGVTTNHSSEEFTRAVLTAPTRSVDEAVAHGLIARPTVVRISMEGAEEFALEGMDGLLSDAENSPRVVLLVCLCESFCVSSVCI